jgi:hypothetical protein
MCEFSADHGVNEIWRRLLSNNPHVTHAFEIGGRTTKKGNLSWRANKTSRSGRVSLVRYALLSGASFDWCRSQTFRRPESSPSPPASFAVRARPNEPDGYATALPASEHPLCLPWILRLIACSAADRIQPLRSRIPDVVHRATRLVSSPHGCRQSSLDNHQIRGASFHTATTEQLKGHTVAA